MPAGVKQESGRVAIRVGKYFLPGGFKLGSPHRTDGYRVLTVKYLSSRL
jgi:hypothetical protein